MTRRYLLAALGWISVILGVIGIFLPIMPTTPFLLLAAWCFSQSSERAHDWLLQHRQLGPLIIQWQHGDGIPAKICYRSIALMWSGMLISMLIVQKLWACALLIPIGLAVSAYIYRQRSPTPPP